MSQDSWPMVAGIGAAAAAAAAVGQLIVSAVALGNQNAGNSQVESEIEDLRRRLRELERLLREKGCEPPANSAPSPPLAIKDVQDLREVTNGLEAKLVELRLVDGTALRGEPRTAQSNTGWFTQFMERRGREFLGGR